MRAIRWNCSYRWAMQSSPSPRPNTSAYYRNMVMQS
uniref:Uncharacterized protein n=1 Tax=Siphoviridae sp. cteNz1 TaxID=2826404 RepID=A0A8S5N5L3_9CAUD|nr:MAG TPA: hypothetical protein [Siphoviridae sp. cteNz1]